MWAALRRDAARRRIRTARGRPGSSGGTGGALRYAVLRRGRDRWSAQAGAACANGSWCNMPLPAEGVPPECGRRRSGRRRKGYHGTTASNAKKILAFGFKRSTGGMLGAGVYWSEDIQKTHSYGDGTVLRLSVLCGRTKKIDSQGHELQTSWHSNGYDTAWVPKNCGMVGSGRSESCTYDPSRIRVTGISNDRGQTWRDVRRYRVVPCMCLLLMVAVVIPVVVFLIIAGSQSDDYEGDGIGIDYCVSSPCANNGTCSSVGADGYMCSCAAGFTGDDCAQEEQEGLGWGWIALIIVSAGVMISGYFFLATSMVPRVAECRDQKEVMYAVFGLVMLVATAASLIFAASTAGVETFPRAMQIVVTFLTFAASAFFCMTVSFGAIVLHHGIRCCSKVYGLIVFATVIMALVFIHIPTQGVTMPTVACCTDVHMAGTTRSVGVRIREGGFRGVLEMNIDDRGWDGVCDDDFGAAEANAVCYQLGFDLGGASYDTTHGDGGFSMDNLNCPSGAVSLSECSTSQAPYSDNCADRETVGIECYQSVEQATPANCSSFGIGDSVRVKSSVERPRHSWGSVTHDDCGIVTSGSSFNSTLTVDFPTHSDWNASANEMERCGPCQSGEQEVDDDVVLKVLVLLLIVVGLGVFASCIVGIKALHERFG